MASPSAQTIHLAPPEPCPNCGRERIAHTVGEKTAPRRTFASPPQLVIYIANLLLIGRSAWASAGRATGVDHTSDGVAAKLEADFADKPPGRDPALRHETSNEPDRDRGADARLPRY